MNRLGSTTETNSANNDSNEGARLRPGAGDQDDVLFSDLPPFLDVPQAARVLGIGRTLAYELVRTSHWPTLVIRVGRLIKIPSGPLLELIATGVAPGGRAVG
jgi:hypothetical protein